jgi:CDP-diacylglycerol--glycerol-3-phosphate 3-phosphatidyltransferase
MGIYALKPKFRESLGFIEQRLIRAGISADTITGFGLLFALAAGTAIWFGRSGGGWLLIVPVAVFLRIAANALDGMVAVATGTTHPRGEVFNETADRVADVAIFLPLIAVPGIEPALVTAAIAVVLVTSTLGIAARAAGGPRIYAGVMGKADRMLVIGIAAVLAYLTGDTNTVFTVALWIVLAGSAVTFVTRIAVARRDLN